MILRFATEPPVLPDAPEARRWLLDELSGAEYRAAEPTIFDRAWAEFFDFLEELLGSGGGSGPVVALIVAAVVVALVVVAFLVFGRPRASARARRAVPLFGGDDRRDAAELRRAADAAAAAGDWALAAGERFRAVVRDLDERELIAVHPGTTAPAAAAGAAARFPRRSAELADAARRFDAIRFLGAAAGPDDDTRLRELDAALRAETPLADAAPASAVPR